MAPKQSILLSAAASAALIATAAFAQTIDDGGRRFTVALTGAQECNPATPPLCGPPNAGDPEGTGTARLTINPGQRRVCWDITVSGIAAPTRGHIHRGARGTNGGIVVTFFESGNVDLEGCTPDDRSLDPKLLAEIIAHPQRFYVNIHTAEFTAGAIRGQLR
jgi:CHRD domain